MKDKDELVSEEEKTKINEEQDLVTKCKSLEKTARAHRRKFDWEWLVRTLYVRGYHFARYNRGTNSTIFGTRTGVRIPVNLVGTHLRGVRNQVTSFQPKWEVLPNVTTESSFENARYSGKTLDYIYKQAQIKRKIKEAVNHALTYSIGIWQFDVDRKGNIVINNIDPFDFFVDPFVKSPNLNDPEYGAEYISLHQQVPLDFVKKNPRYENTDQLQKDSQIASAEYKQFLLQVVKNRYNEQNDDNQTIILKHTWMRERQENGDFKIRMVTYVDQMDVPLRNEITDSDEYPFEILQGDIASGELYGESWVKHLIPINRVIDALESHIFEYNHFFAKGRFVIDKNSGARIIVNQHGQIIEKNRGATVTSLPISPLPPSPQEQLASMRRNLEDLSGVHDVSLGRLPGTIRSGVAIAELKQADATNQNDLIDNLEDFLARSGRKILKLVAENWNTSKLISVTGLGGKPEYFMAIGEQGNIKNKKKNKYTFGEMDLPLAIIGADNEVRVQVGSWLAYTKEARQEKLKELFRLGAIDQKTYLEYSEFADIDGIIKRTRDEQMLQARSGQTSQAVQNQFSGNIQLTDEELALAENELMMEGVDQPVHPDDDHQIHISIHKEHADDDIVRAHMNEHINVDRWQLNMQTRGMPPQGGEGAEGPPISPDAAIPPGQPIGGMPENGGGPGGIGMAQPNLAEMFGPGGGQ